MATIRVFAENDIGAAAALLARVSPEHGWRTAAECESYFRDILFDNPWRELELPSWVAEQDGRMAGFYAVIPRPMVVRGRRIRAAVGCQITVAPECRHSLTALQLVQACLRGPQDLTFADAAHIRARRFWLGIGGAAPTLYGLDWIRPLRPAGCVLSLLEQRPGVARSLLRPARPLGALVDLFAKSRGHRFEREAADVVDEDLDAATMFTHLAEVLDGNALRPVYDARSLAWLIRQAGRKTCHGRLRARGVRDRNGQLLGWYLYFVQLGGISEVVQIAARKNDYDRVLRRLFADAWRQGAAAVRGRLDPQYLEELSAHQCWFRKGSRSILVHSRDPDIIEAFSQGEAFLSRLDGEWWVRLVNFYA